MKLKVYSVEMLGAICVGLCGGEVCCTVKSWRGYFVVRMAKFTRLRFAVTAVKVCKILLCATQLCSASQSNK
jgi:hypothetical protein